MAAVLPPTPAIIQPLKPAQTTPKKVTKTSIFYINDVHSNLGNLERLKSASDEFDAFVPSTDTAKLKFSSGDVGVGRDKNFSKLAVTFQNTAGIMANAGGNHEFDLPKEDLAEVLKDAKYKFLGINVDIPKDTDVNKELRKDIVKSYVQVQNGEKFGVIGLLPFDFEFHLSDPQEYHDFKVLPVEKTIPILQNEVEELKKQGVNKIIVLSHAGYSDDVQIAKSVEGIDVILGGHTHDLVKGITEGKNLFYSKKTGEPTIITQAGKNGDYFGILNLEFNDKGVITSAQNNVSPTVNYPRNSVMKHLADSVLGKAEVVGTVKSAPKHIHTLIDENPTVNFLADAERSELGTDMVMVNAGNIRACIEEGPLTNRDLQIITPFDNKLWILRLTEKELVDAVKIGAKSLTKVDNTPGILQFSGLKYTMTKSGEVTAMTYIDKDGKEASIDVKNPNPFKTYTVAVDDFIAKGGNDYLSGRLDAVEKKYDYDKNKVVIDYLKKHSEPIVINTEKRITVVDK